MGPVTRGFTGEAFRLFQLFGDQSASHIRKLIFRHNFQDAAQGIQERFNSGFDILGGLFALEKDVEAHRSRTGSGTAPDRIAELFLGS